MYRQGSSQGPSISQPSTIVPYSRPAGNNLSAVGNAQGPAYNVTPSGKIASSNRQRANSIVIVLSQNVHTRQRFDNMTQRCCEETSLFFFFYKMLPVRHPSCTFHWSTRPSVTQSVSQASPPSLTPQKNVIVQQMKKSNVIQMV